MSESLKTRPWWRLHLLTWVLVLFVGGALVVENLVDCNVYKEWHAPGSTQANRVGLPSFGWPFEYTKIKKPRSSKEEIEVAILWIGPHEEIFVWGFSKYLDYSISYLFTIVLIALLILFATIFTTESYLRRQSKWQFTIQGIILLTVFVALLLTNAKYNLVRWRGDETWEYFPFFFIALGLWCVFWTGWRLVAAGVGRIGGGMKDG